MGSDSNRYTVQRYHPWAVAQLSTWKKTQKRGHFKTPPYPTGRRSNNTDYIIVNSSNIHVKEAPYSWFSLKHFLNRSESSRDSRVESSRSGEIFKNKTPAQAFTPPAEKKRGAKWAFMYNCSGREHEKWLFKNI